MQVRTVVLRPCVPKVVEIDSASTIAAEEEHAGTTYWTVGRPSPRIAGRSVRIVLRMIHCWVIGRRIGRKSDRQISTRFMGSNQSYLSGSSRVIDAFRLGQFLLNDFGSDLQVEEGNHGPGIEYVSTQCLCPRTCVSLIVSSPLRSW